MVTRDDIEQAIYDVVVDHPMWIDDDGNPLDYLPEREIRIGDFIGKVTDSLVALLAPSSGMSHVATTGEGKSPATHQSGGRYGAEESGRGSVETSHYRTFAAPERTIP